MMKNNSNLFFLLGLLMWSCAIEDTATNNNASHTSTVDTAEADTASNDTTNSNRITDADGNAYTSVTIGAQEWMVENLRTTKYANGDPIRNVTDNDEWHNFSTGAYSWYDNDSVSYESVYGALYNWYAVADSRNVCPTGWHVPTDAEWTILTDYILSQGLDEYSVGTSLKSTNGWNEYNGQRGNGTDDYGFSGLPGGNRSSYGSFVYLGEYGPWWSSTEFDRSDVWSRELSYKSGAVDRSHYFKECGFSIRCLKD